MVKLKYLLFVVCTALLFSCKSVPDDLIMFHDLNKGRNFTGTLVNKENSRTIILPGNVLRIIVSSGNVMDAKTYDQFNLLPVTPSTPTASSLTGVSGEMEFQTYTVDENGEIEFPKFGKIKATGLTHFELEALLQEKLKPHLSDPIVSVSITQNYVNVLGEVATPGLIEIENRHNYSILDAIAEAGGITSIGDRKRIKLIREENGRLESVVLDLTSSDVFSSPYYYLKQNDIVVVDMNSSRQKDAQYGTSDNYKLSVISTIVGALSSTLTIIFLLSDRLK
ncbi:MAG: polysaccharide export protein [Dysgonamonadaceae bacterium]|jgi:polysaccharide export outer membrane protein|nr:polysaccharide export protein [Dysgonamonadaceae bacterium]